MHKYNEFVRESWMIERQLLDIYQAEPLAVYHEDWINYDEVTVATLTAAAHKFTNGKGVLRSLPGYDVTIGGEIKRGSQFVTIELGLLCNDAPDMDPFELHQRFEHLHPFMDGNGRVGRLLWLWSMGGETDLPFLHLWYYQSLRDWKIKKKALTEV